MPEALSWSAYSDPALPALDRGRIFARAWQYIGHKDQLGEGPGYVAGRVGDIPLLIAFDRDGTLVALVNRCRHCVTHLAAVAAALQTVQCPFHGGTDGGD